MITLVRVLFMAVGAAVLHRIGENIDFDEERMSSDSSSSSSDSYSSDSYPSDSYSSDSSSSDSYSSD